jgi:small GTP-binding protein
MLEMKRKVCLVGDEGVGKTCLIRRFAYDMFDEAYIRTVGTMVSKREVDLPDMGYRVILMIWDIMGFKDFMELFKSAYFNHVKGIVAVFDLTRPKTLDSLDGWIGSVQSSVGKIPAVVLANKMDLEMAERSLDEDIHGFCDSRALRFLKTSAKTGENVKEAISYLAAEMVIDEEQGRPSPSVEPPLIPSISPSRGRTA